MIASLASDRAGRLAAGGRLAVALVLGALALANTGCLSAKKYRLAKEGMPEAVPLEWTAETAGPDVPVAVVVEQVITFKGPGSWKQEARWDEFVVRLENHSDEELVVETVELLDWRGVPHEPGADPWALEKLSRSNWERYGRLGLKLAAGAGGVVLYAGAVTAVGIGSALSGGAAAGAGAAALSVIPIVAVVNIGVVLTLNHQNKTKVEAEFERRRLALPLSLAARSGRQGSWFFPLTPAPQRLLVRGRLGARAVEWRLELPALARLHLRPED